MFGNSERETSAARPTAEVTYTLHEYTYIFCKMIYVEYQGKIKKYRIIIPDLLI